ncbi:hypothetical protein CSPAE12_01477 [Colletotrichum incanum]|nr:hypothetical protein CSPAE12_01477 [Colletotrichum incanum]
MHQYALKEAENKSLREENNILSRRTQQHRSIRKRVAVVVVSQGLNQVNDGMACAGTQDTTRERVILL